ncbi:matrixin family metalloprotease [Methylovorus mays]|uniref:matrixin family metalloprotease n=1 Tax=Methylovorus mays TaxID=184077 RepID=UPI001E4630AE|nr:matrixin family metalloprotease [Methylovorus mays]MCB5208260.1 M10 family metallopeptidase C-terminal domain-containing protein [Methylovorus mays]
MAKSTSFDDYVTYLIDTNKNDTASGSLGKTTITVSLAGLMDNSQQESAARLALEAWEDATGLTFTIVTSGSADIYIGNDDEQGAGAYAYEENNARYVNVSENWMDGFPADEQWSVGSYGVQTFIHEIGHTLGLGHGGPYNVNGTYAKDAIFAIDTNQYSIMSYFDQSNYGGASNLFLLSPMMADIAAIRLLYGSLATNTGDTLYGLGETVLGGTSDMGSYAGFARTISDSDGTDTMDFSNVSRGSVIDMRAGGFSSINGYKKNFAIAQDTVIENLNATLGSDTVTGNDADNMIYGLSGNDKISAGGGNDTLDGGLGSDTLTGGLGDDVYYINSSKDVISEKADGGSDVVYSSVSYTMASYLEEVVLQGSASTKLKATGNAMANQMTGDDGANVLSGGAGNDTLAGGLGRDTLSGGAGNDSLDGGDANDKLDGGAGNDTLLGGAGNDLLKGGAGSDIFIIADGTDHDIISDFFYSSSTSKGITTIVEDKLYISGHDYDQDTVFDGDDYSVGLAADDSGLLFSFYSGGSLLLKGVGESMLEKFNIAALHTDDNGDSYFSLV